MLSPKLPWDSHGAAQHMSGDVHIVLDTGAHNLGSYEASDDGTTMQRRAVYAAYQPFGS